MDLEREKKKYKEKVLLMIPERSEGIFYIRLHPKSEDQWFSSPPPAAGGVPC